jgi:hypothetical protein
VQPLPLHTRQPSDAGASGCCRKTAARHQHLLGCLVGHWWVSAQSLLPCKLAGRHQHMRLQCYVIEPLCTACTRCGVRTKQSSSITWHHTMAYDDIQTMQPAAVLSCFVQRPQCPPSSPAGGAGPGQCQGPTSALHHLQGHLVADPGRQTLTGCLTNWPSGMNQGTLFGGLEHKDNGI